MSNSEEEEIARDFLCFGDAQATLVIVDATCLERNLNLVYQILEITNNVIVCVNLLDEAKKKGININLKLLSKILGVPVVGTVARKKKSLNNLISVMYKVCSGTIKCSPNPVKYNDDIEKVVSKLLPIVTNILPKQYLYLSKWITMKIIDGDKKILSSIENFTSTNLHIASIVKVLENINLDISTNFSFRDSVISNIIATAETVALKVCSFEKENYNLQDIKIDKILTSKSLGFPIMIIFLGIIFWITIVGANYPSELLSKLFSYIQEKLVLLFDFLKIAPWLKGVLIDGMYKTVSWVVAVMLPPMAIFFPLFTLLEDLGYLPRIAFNLDKCFKKACSSRKASSNYVYGIWM